MGLHCRVVSSSPAGVLWVVVVCWLYRYRRYHARPPRPHVFVRLFRPATGILMQEFSASVIWVVVVCWAYRIVELTLGIPSLHVSWQLVVSRRVWMHVRGVSRETHVLLRVVVVLA